MASIQCRSRPTLCLQTLEILAPKPPTVRCTTANNTKPQHLRHRNPSRWQSVAHPTFTPTAAPCEPCNGDGILARLVLKAKSPSWPSSIVMIPALNNTMPGLHPCALQRFLLLPPDRIAQQRQFGTLRSICLLNEVVAFWMPSATSLSLAFWWHLPSHRTRHSPLLIGRCFCGDSHHSTIYTGAAPTKTCCTSFL